MDPRVEPAGDNGNGEGWSDSRYSVTPPSTIIAVPVV
jgi:hypothetical protein